METLRAFGEHGGRQAQAAALFPEAPQPWLDLSTGVNPQAYPFAGAAAGDRARLPEPEAVAELERVAAAAFGVEPERVCAVPGAEAGARLLSRSLEAATVGILQPTYDGHAQAWRDAGRQVHGLRREDIERASPRTDRRFEAVVLVNPNNPDGLLVAPSQIASVVETMAARDGWLIVDEAFADAEPSASVAAQAGGRLVVLRSFGKFYGLAGVRLGFILGEPAVIARLRRRQGSWPISADAIAAGCAAYPDAAWADATRTRLRRDSARLDAILERAGLVVAGGTTLFRLARTQDAAGRFRRLAAAGILTRPFDYAPEWLRFGLPPADAWPRLERALMETAG